MADQEFPPGSDKAIAEGCSCPVLDNSRGQGWMGIEGVYVMNGKCPLHAAAVERAHKNSNEKAGKAVADREAILHTSGAAGALAALVALEAFRGVSVELPNEELLRTGSPELEQLMTELLISLRWMCEASRVSFSTCLNAAAMRLRDEQKGTYPRTYKLDASVPEHWPNRYNTQLNEPCDMIQGLCSCGVTHSLDEDWVQEMIKERGL